MTESGRNETYFSNMGHVTRDTIKLRLDWDGLWSLRFQTDITVPLTEDDWTPSKLLVTQPQDVVQMFAKNKTEEINSVPV